MSKAKNKGFFVLEQEDCENYLSVTEQNILWELQKKVLASRHINGKICVRNILLLIRVIRHLKRLQCCWLN